MVVDIDHQLSKVLTRNPNVTVCHRQYGMTIRRRPQSDLLHGMSRQSVERKGVERRQETLTGNTQVGYRRTGRKMFRRRGPKTAGLQELQG